MSDARLFARALGAFLALPGMVAFVLPLWIVRGDPRAHAFAWPGLPVLALGLFVLLWCVRDFYVSGKGTLAPWAPPRNLVVVGLYRRSRNPMYLGVLTILVGWAIAFGSPRLAFYAAAISVMFHLRVVLNEEPFLARTHGDAWQRYRAQVRRWL